MTTALTDSRYRYRIFAMVFFIALINYVDRGALSFAANDISREFNFNKAQLGAVLGYFGFGYLFGSLCGGFLADRVGTKKVWLIAGALWSLLEIATAWAGELGLRCSGARQSWVSPHCVSCSVLPKGRPMR